MTAAGGLVAAVVLGVGLVVARGVLPTQEAPPDTPAVALDQQADRVVDDARSRDPGLRSAVLRGADGNPAAVVLDPGDATAPVRMVSLDLPATGNQRDYVLWATGMPGNAPVAVAVMDPADGVTRPLDATARRPDPGTRRRAGGRSRSNPRAPCPRGRRRSSRSGWRRPEPARPPATRRSTVRRCSPFPGRSPRAPRPRRRCRRRGARITVDPAGDHPAGGGERVGEVAPMAGVSALTTGELGVTSATDHAEASPGRPMLASAGDVPRGAGWAFEFLWDGLRCLARTGDEGLRLVADARRDMTSHFRELGIAAPSTAPGGLVLDGVIVAWTGSAAPAQASSAAGPTSPTRRNPAARVPVPYYVFDVLEVAGVSTRRLPYRQRRELLAQLDLSGSRVVIPPYFAGVGAEAVVTTARRYGLDGVVAKRLEPADQVGRRSRSSMRRPCVVSRTSWSVARSRRAGGRTRSGRCWSGCRASRGCATGPRAHRGHRGGAARARRCAGRARAAREPLRRRGARGRAGCRALAGPAPGRAGGAPPLDRHRAARATRRGGVRAAHPATVAAPVLAAPVVDTDLDLDDLETAESPSERAARHRPVGPPSPTSSRRPSPEASSRPCARASRRTSYTTRSPRSRPTWAPTRPGPASCSPSSPTSRGTRSAPGAS